MQFCDTGKTLSYKYINMNKNYTFDDFDKHASLKFNTAIWIVIAFLLRPYVVVASSLANRSNRMEFINLVYSDFTSMSLSALAALPTMLLIYAWARREPAAPQHVKHIWKAGKILLLVSTLGNAVIAGITLMQGNAYRIEYVALVQLIICGLIVVYLSRSQWVKDTFADFPTSPPAT